MTEVGAEAAEAWERNEEMRRALLATVDVHELLAVLRRRLGLRQEDIAVAAGVSARAVRQWEKGGDVRRRHQDRLRALAFVAGRCLEMMTAQGATQWLVGRNPHVNWKRPIELVGDDDPDAALALIESFGAGDVV